MNEVALHEEKSPLVFVEDGEVYASSRDVAEFFEKRHDHVLRDTDALIESLRANGDDPLSKFGEGSYTLESTGDQRHRCYNLSRDGFILLAMGFTGTKALKFKLAYIEAFNAMEKKIRESSADVTRMLDDPKALRQLVIASTEKIEQLQAENAEMQPKVEALGKIAEADGSLCITDAAKALQMRPKDLFSYLSEHGWTYRRPGGTHWLGYQTKVTTGLLEHKVTTVLRPDGTEKVSEQVRVTPKGLTKLAMLIQPIAKVA